MSDCGCQFEAKNRQQRQVLRILFAVNAVMFMVGMTAGAIARSTALVADSLDMLADAAVFGISLYAIGKSPLKKVQAAFLSGIFQTTLASLVLFEVIRRFIWGSEPESSLMMATALLSLIVNCYCLVLMFKHRHEEVHLRASWIFLSNDVIANFGVIMAGLLVNVLNSRIPDLMIGFIIAVVVMRGGISIIQDARHERQKLQSSSS
jgi:cation diffusion facilitator family transporter